MTTFISITREGHELTVEVDSLDTSTGYVDEAVGPFAKDQPIALTQAEQADADERILTRSMCLAKRDIDLEVDDHTPSEMDAQADRYFEGRGRV